MTWPPRWTEPHFKGVKTSRVAKRVKRANEKTAEEKNKKQVRRRDKRCRFPMCGCRRLKIQPHVAHLEHKGIGGNPAGDRSQPELMILVCACRHRENRISIDKGTLRCKPFMSDEAARRIGKPGTLGPVVWEIRFDELPEKIQKMRRKTKELREGWLTIAYEWPEPGQHGYLDLDVLEWLASMEV